MSDLIRPYDIDDLRQRFQSADPFPHIVIDDFLDEDFVRKVRDAYPSFEDAKGMGREFTSVNEKLKVQICDSAEFLTPVGQLSEAIAAPEFLRDLAEITGIPNLLPDAELRGGGMHLTNAAGRLDVHVDFNYIEEEKLHRRLNILVYLNEDWEDGWGGEVELWDKEVRTCHQSLSPVMNRCVIFETSNISFHGVTSVSCPPGEIRKSFAAYYYTRDAPAYWTGVAHSTIFKARPDEALRGRLLMPAERIRRGLIEQTRSLKRRLGAIVRRRSS